MLLVVAVPAIALLWLRPYGDATAQQEGMTIVHYGAGWNLVAAPTGTELSGTSGSQYAFGPDGTGYVIVHPGELVGGRAVWAYFPADTQQELGPTAATYTRILTPANQWELLGNPSTTQSLPIAGADEALAYDPSTGYHAVDTLAPGQGAWVISQTGGEISAGTPPSDQTGQTLRRLQAELTANPTDRANVDMLGTVAAELVQNRRYDEVQAVMDDLRSAFEDGLRLQHAAPLPEMSSVQTSSARTVRASLAMAQEAVALGDTTGADHALATALAAATAAENDAEAHAATTTPAATSTPAGGTIVYQGLRQSGAGTPASLAAFGGLVRTAFFGSALGQAPAEPFWTAASSLLSSSPLPVQPAPVAAAVTASATPAIPCETDPCTFSGSGTAILTITDAKDFQFTTNLTFTLTAFHGQVSGQGSETTTYMLGTGTDCNIPSSQASLTVSGTEAGGMLHLTFVAGSGSSTLSCEETAAPFPTGFNSAAEYGVATIAAQHGASTSVPPSAQFSQGWSGSFTISLQ